MPAARHRDRKQILRRHATVLNLWIRGWRSGAIARVTGYQATTIKDIIARARVNGDVRAVRRRR